MSRTLWMTSGGTRYFLVPDDAPWPFGHTPVRELMGDQRGADLDALGHYELTPAQVREWSTGETARIEAELDAAADTAPTQPADPQLTTLLTLMQAGDARDLVEGFGLDAARLEAEPERAAALFAEVLMQVTAAADPRRRAAVIENIAAVLDRHDHPIAAKKVREAPITLAPVIEALQRLATQLGD